jgi:hypothetical protein
MKHAAALIALSLGVSACGSPEPTPGPVENEALAAESRAGLAGDVVELPGGEGLNLVVAQGDAPGRYRLEMQYSLNDRGVFDGVATDEGIAFSRPDGAQVLKAGDGDATGLKWLAGKRDCLVVKPAEGYCRD